MNSSQSPARRIFFGAEGLRAGWSLALFLFLPVTLRIAAHYIARAYPLAFQQSKGPTELTPALTSIGEGVTFGILALLTLAMSAIEHRPFSSYGLALRRAVPDLARGLFWGFAMLSVLIAALTVTHSIGFHGLAIHGPVILADALEWLFAFFLVGLFEEFAFRGFLQFTLARGVTGTVRALSPNSPHAAAIGFWVAALVFSGAFFAWTHTSNGGETPFGIFAVALAGLTFAFALYRTGTLWWAIGFHTAWDWAQSFFYGTPDSGNLAQGHLLATNPAGNPTLSGASAGPEGSVLVVPTLLLACLVIHLTLPKRPIPDERFTLN